MHHPSWGPAALAARLTWGALRGPTLDREDVARLALGLGGVVLFDRNLRDPDDAAALTASIRRAATAPVRIAVDQEGGHVIRLGAPLTRFPGPMAIGAAGSARLARAIALASGRELRSLGIDTVLAPVLDVAVEAWSPVIGARSFGDRPADVARLGAATVRGYLDAGILPVPKHLPGHGRARGDTHVARAVVRGLARDLERVDLPPFVAAVRAGAPALMVGHVILEGVDAVRPASLSPATALLARRRLEFAGVLVTDALVMAAITAEVPLRDAGAIAIRAGMDVAMAIEGQAPILEGLTEALQAGAVPRSRISAALGHVRALEDAARALDRRVPARPLSEEMLAAHAALAAEVARRSLVLVGDPLRRLPLCRSAGLLIVDVAAPFASPVESPAGLDRGAAARLVRTFPRARLLEVRADEPDAAAVLAAAAGAEAVLLLTRDAFATPAVDLARRLWSATRPLVHVALRNPSDLAWSAADAAIAAFADTAPTIDALGLALEGATGFPGRLPVRWNRRPFVWPTGPASPSRGRSLVHAA